MSLHSVTEVVVIIVRRVISSHNTSCYWIHLGETCHFIPIIMSVGRQSSVPVLPSSHCLLCVITISFCGFHSFIIPGFRINAWSWKRKLPFHFVHCWILSCQHCGDEFVFWLVNIICKQANDTLPAMSRVSLVKIWELLTTQPATTLYNQTQGEQKWFPAQTCHSFCF